MQILIVWFAALSIMDLALSATITQFWFQVFAQAVVLVPITFSVLIALHVTQVAIAAMDQQTHPALNALLIISITLDFAHRHARPAQPKYYSLESVAVLLLASHAIALTMPIVLAV